MSDAVEHGDMSPYFYRATPEPSDAMVEAAARTFIDLHVGVSHVALRRALAAALATGEYVPKAEREGWRRVAEMERDRADEAEAALADARAALARLHHEIAEEEACLLADAVPRSRLQQVGWAAVDVIGVAFFSREPGPRLVPVFVLLPENPEET